MTDRLNKAFLAGSPTFAQSGPARASNAVFGGVAVVASGTSGVAVTGVDVRSESVVFLGAPTFVTNAVSGFARPFGVTSMTVGTPTNSGQAGFVISTVDSKLPSPQPASRSWFGGLAPLILCKPDNEPTVERVGLGACANSSALAGPREGP